MIFRNLLLFLVCVGFIVSCGKTIQVTVVPKHSDSPSSDLLHDAIRFKQKKQYENALNTLDSYALVSPNDDALYYLKYEIYSSLNQPEKATLNLEKAAQFDPKNSWYLKSLTEQYVQTQKFNKALEGYKKLVVQDPHNVELLLDFAECYLKNGNLKEALSTLTKVEAEIGENPEIAIEKFRIYRYLKQDDKGEELLISSLKKFPNDRDLLANLVDFYFEKKRDEEAINILFQLSKSDPMNGNVHLTLAQYYLQKHQMPETFSELKLAFVCPEISLETKTRLILYFYDNQAKVDTNVIELCHLLVKHYPNEAKVYTLFGDVYLKNDQEKEALEAFKKSVELDPSKYSIWEQILYMDYEFQMYDALYLDGKKTVELFPTHSKAYLLAGTGANQTKRYTEATEILSLGKVLVIKNNELLAEFHAQLGQAYFKLKNREEAISNYKKAIELAPLNQLNKNNFAYYLANEKWELDIAYKLIQEVISLSPNDHHFLDTYGWVLFQQGNFEESLVMYQKAATTAPNDALIVEHLGDANFKLGNHELAISFWKKALELGSKDQNLPKKIEKKHYYDPNY